METGNKLLWCKGHPFVSLALVFAALALGLLSTDARVAIGDGGSGLAPLNTVPAPVRTGGDIVNNKAAIALGKALFWDVQVGGDGQIACATCHYHAGADNRTFNTLHPGPDGIFDSGAPPKVFAAGQDFHAANIVNDDRVGSQGIVGSIFVGLTSGRADNCADDHTAPFFGERRVTGRQAPLVIGAVFNRQNFWDGRANDNFNGANPFGLTGNTAAAGGSLGGTVTNSSLASQAVGPPNNPVEMSCAGRAFNGPGSLGAKMLARTPLQFQFVHLEDSALGELSNWPDRGLKKSYSQLISDAFGPNSDLFINREAKFSRVWGQAVQAYMSTLVPDRTPLDKFLAGDRNALTSTQQKGLGIFTGKAGCTKCHAGAELTDASLSFAAQRGLVNEDGGDQGFHNIGVRPTAEDIGRAATGPGGVSFSESGSAMDRGAFKTPGLRNVKLTAPYFANGVKATLADVVDFYNRGGDFPNPEKAKRIRPMGLGAGDKAALIEFLTNALTDCRVEQEKAPFDHPSLEVPSGPSVPATGGGHCD